MHYFSFHNCPYLSGAWVSLWSSASGPAFPAFLFTQRKFHFSPKTVGFFSPLFHFKGFGQIIFQSLFLGQGGLSVSVFLLEKRNGCSALFYVSVTVKQPDTGLPWGWLPQMGQTMAVILSHTPHQALFGADPAPQALGLCLPLARALSAAWLPLNYLVP